jgi:hypothetical protein
LNILRISNKEYQMGFFGFIGSVFSAAVSAFKSVIEKVGLVFETALKIIVGVVEVVGKALGIIPEDEVPEELGDRVIQAEDQGIVPDKFDSYAEYMKKVRELEIDPELSEKSTLEEKRAAFLSVANKGIEEKFDSKISLLFWGEVAKNNSYFTPERVTSILKEFSSNGMDPAKISDYFKANLAPDERQKVEDCLVKSEQNIDADKDIDSIYNELDSMKR